VLGGGAGAQVDVTIFGTAPFQASILTNPSYPSGPAVILGVAMYGNTLRVTTNAPQPTDGPASFQAIVQVCNACGSVDVPIVVQVVQTAPPPTLDCDDVTGLFADASRAMAVTDLLLAQDNTGACVLVTPVVTAAVTCSAVQGLFVHAGRPMQSGDLILANVGGSCLYVQPPALTLTCASVQALFSSAGRPMQSGDLIMANVGGSCLYVEPPTGGGGAFDICNYMATAPALDSSDIDFGLTNIYVPALRTPAPCGRLRLVDAVCPLLFSVGFVPLTDLPNPSGDFYLMPILWNSGEERGCLLCRPPGAIHVQASSSPSITTLPSTQILASNGSATTAGVITVEDICLQCGGGGGDISQSFARYSGYADDLLEPNSTDWAVLGVASAVADGLHSGFRVRVFTAVPHAVGMNVYVPINATRMRMRIVTRGTAMTFNFYHRLATAVEPWSGPAPLSVFSSASFQLNTFDDELSGGLYGALIETGNEYQFELVNNTPFANVAMLSWHVEFY